MSNQPSVFAAVFFTLSVPVAAAEMLLTALYLPWPAVPLFLAAAASFLTVLATQEWTDLHARRQARKTRKSTISHRRHAHRLPIHQYPGGPLTPTTPRAETTNTDNAGSHVVLLDRDGDVIVSQPTTIKTRDNELSVEHDVRFTGVDDHVDTVELRDANGQCRWRSRFNGHLVGDEAIVITPGW